MADDSGFASAQVSSRHLELDLSIGQASFSAAGEGEMVLRALRDFRDFMTEAPINLNGQDATTELDTGKLAAVQASDVSDGDVSLASNALSPAPRSSEEQLPVFLKLRPALKTNAQIAAGISVWANRFKGQEEITTDEMEAFWRTSRYRVPSNISRDMSAATKEGWLQRVSSGKYASTSYGERYVDEQLTEAN